MADHSTDLRNSLVDFLERLGFVVEIAARGSVVASRRTMLDNEDRRFYVDADANRRPSRSSALLVGNDAPDPPEPDRGQWYRFDDFLDRTVRAGELAQEAVDLYNDEAVRQQLAAFVPQRVKAPGIGQFDSSVDFFFEDWLDNPDSRLLAVLAPAGYGKTLLSAELARRLGSAYLASVETPRKPVPFLIPFGNFRRIGGFEGMILTALEQRGVHDMTSTGFAFLVEHQRVVLFLDGFDELLEERPGEAQKNLRELIETLGDRGKVVLTARSTFFRTSVDVADFLESSVAASEVQVIELQPFDAAQRRQFLSLTIDNEKDRAQLSKLVESDSLREAMGSPLLLRQVVENSSGFDLDASAGAEDLFKALEQAVYSRERTRHGHEVPDIRQRAFLVALAGEMLIDNARGFDFESIQVAALEALEDTDPEASDIARLADHHFLTVDPGSKEVRFNHQVFREYYQAVRLLGALEQDDVAWVVEVLMSRPLPAAVTSTVLALGGPEAVRLLLELSERPLSLQAANNIAAVLSENGEWSPISQFLSSINHDLNVSLKLKDLDLTRTEFPRRRYGELEFTNADLTEARITNANIERLSLCYTPVTGADFSGTTIESALFDFTDPLFGNAPILQRLIKMKANTGHSSEAIESEKDLFATEVTQFIATRIRRFHVAGPSGSMGSKWDTWIQERNLLGGIVGQERNWARRAVVPALVRAGVLVRSSRSGVKIYGLTDKAKDDCRALIEEGLAKGLIKDAIERIV